jgi:hypothetical protein
MDVEIPSSRLFGADVVWLCFEAFNWMGAVKQYEILIYVFQDLVCWIFLCCNCCLVLPSRDEIRRASPLNIEISGHRSLLPLSYTASTFYSPLPT